MEHATEQSPNLHKNDLSRCIGDGLTQAVVLIIKKCYAKKIGVTLTSEQLCNNLRVSRSYKDSETSWFSWARDLL